MNNEVKMEVKMEVIEGSCSLYFIIFYGVRSLRQKWTIEYSSIKTFKHSDICPF